jgi:hypothetical protein
MSRKRPKHMNSEKREEKEEVKNKKKAEKEKFLKRIFGEEKKGIVLVAAVFFVIGFVISTFAGFSGSPTTGMVVSKEDIGAKVADYINNNIIPAGSSVSVVSVEEENGLYLVTTLYQENPIPVYATKDGILLLVGTVYDMTQELEPPPEEPEEPAATCDDVEKADKAKMETWVVSMCPFGTQAMNGMYYVAELFGDKADVIVRYITGVDADGNPTAMHGADEQNENQRQTCLREEQPDKFWDYIHCYVETGDAATCETTAGVDSDALDDCFENRGKDYMLNEAYEWATIYQPSGGRGSPSFFMNGATISEYSFDPVNGRSPNNLKNILCCGMDTPLDECSTQLNTANPPTGYGVMGESSSASSGSC